MNCLDRAFFFFGLFNSANIIPRLAPASLVSLNELEKANLFKIMFINQYQINYFNYMKSC